jgi:hypothetical protein
MSVEEFLDMGVTVLFVLTWQLKDPRYREGCKAFLSVWIRGREIFPSCHGVL